MLRFSVTGTLNLAWGEVAAAAALAEALGFEAMYTSDHLHAVAGFASDVGALDALSLTLALAPLTSGIRLGCLVSPITVRHPVVLARALQTLDLVSGGRAEVGIGAGWEAGEHRSFGLPFPPMAERLDRLDDACRIMTALWESDAPVTLDGWYPLRDAQLIPRPVQARIPLLVAAASDRGIAVAARWARSWCGIGSPAYLADRIARLRREEASSGRAPGSVETTSMLRVFLSDDPDAVADLKAAVAQERTGGGARPQRGAGGGPDHRLVRRASRGTGRAPVRLRGGRAPTGRPGHAPAVGSLGAAPAGRGRRSGAAHGVTTAAVAGRLHGMERAAR